MESSTKTASLILEDGSVFEGYLFGAKRSSPGEIGEFHVAELQKHVRSRRTSVVIFCKFALFVATKFCCKSLLFLWDSLCVCVCGMVACKLFTIFERTKLQLLLVYQTNIVILSTGA